tara:strand:+ start:720 stop:1472 length:753 start_codon:yes stop_codon:yes gene_type:complete
MAYIGKTPTVGNFQKCDAISVVNGQAAYTLQVGGSNVSPESPNHILVSLNGIIQAPTDSYTVSGATLTFASNLATGDSIDFVILLGNVLDLGVPSDATVTNAKIASDAAIATTKLGAGAILQTVTGNELTSAVTTTSNSFVDSGLFVNITPSSTSSKILISTNMNTRNDTASGGCVTTIYRDSTPLSSSGNIQFQANGNHHSSTFQQFLDSPSTTSQITYKMYFYRFNTGTAHISAEWGGARMFALEVQG